MMLGEFFLAYQMEGRVPARTGNDHPLWVPHGTFRCRGNDNWVSIAVRSDDEWTALCRVTGLVGLRRDARYATAEGRRAHRRLLHTAISAWMRDQDKFDVMERLQRSGVPAGAVLNAKELVENPHLESRGFMVAAQAPEGGVYPMPGTTMTVDGRKRQVWCAAPYRGEHNRTVLKELLGLSDAQIDALRDAGALVEDAPAVR